MNFNRKINDGNNYYYILNDIFFLSIVYFYILYTTSIIYTKHAAAYAMHIVNKNQTSVSYSSSYARQYKILPFINHPK